ncbi:capsule biosynthesis protein [Burkholderia pseudomallei]|uniref:capsule biosynthesis protein n=1 Tax=Burkholderia pseudomallei TaxID=28450 RepID=UPI0009D5AF54|nr:capsule biosynthesis protein [Burkholderia pseudomallei]ONC95577.1 capsule biosynthesis protein [Burkholderia pseudomallei]OND02259.1 capsule biosynthesis protein [Burkholderia pseudomallei]OND12606.1 capsule biosynthesis protein [Burkholderia pseudomallei]OND16862.1 capsule biosynthesis protein [Burkholderia pseudomallei]OND22095.1 capsule biosynthesis protein [Burkholderia pseudomallei]
MNGVAFADFFSGNDLPMLESVIAVSNPQAALARARERYSDCSPAIDTPTALGYVFNSWRFLLETGDGQVRLRIQSEFEGTDLEHRQLVLRYLLTDARASSISVDELLPASSPYSVDAAELVDNPSSVVSKRATMESFDAPAQESSWFWRVWTIGRLRLTPLFLVTVVLPTAIATLYYGLIASDVYISESQFILRTPKRTSEPGLGALLQGVSLSKTSDDTSVVQDYIKSRDALVVLEQKMPLRDAFGGRYADIFSRFPGVIGRNGFEYFYRYFKNHVAVDVGTATAVTTLRVQAYTSKDAYLINKYLLEMAEKRVNELNDRSRQDSLRYALAEVAGAEAKVKAASTALSKFRSKASLFDPDRQSNIQLELVAKLRGELIAKQAQLSQLRMLSPQNPQIPSLAASIGALEASIASEKGGVAGEKNSLSDRSVEYQRLALEQSFGEKLLASALTSLEQARADAERKQIYLERVAEPNEPDVAMEPKRVRNIFACFILGLAAWGVLSMLVAGIREHQE